MGIKREDLMAAAATGVVQYTQVDPLLIFLSQRDANRQREAMLQQQQPPRKSGRQFLFYMLALICTGAAAALMAIYTKLTMLTFGTESLLWFIGLYALFTLVMAAWFERRRVATWVRIFVTSVIAVLPLAVFASQRISL